MGSVGIRRGSDAARTPRPPRRDRADVMGGAFVALSSACFGAVVILGKFVTDAGVPVPGFLSLRFLIAAAMMAVVVGATRGTLRAAPGEGLGLAALGVFGYAVEAALFFLAIEHGGPAAVTLLFFTYPVWVAAVAGLTGGGLPAAPIAGALLAALLGAALVILGSGGLEITAAGIAFALAAAATYSLYLTGADRVLRATDSLTASMWVSATAGAALGVVGLAGGHAGLPPRASVWFALVGAAAFTAAAFILLFAGLRRLGAVRTAIVAATEPLVASVLSVLVYGERMAAATVVGGLLIVGGAAAASVARAGGATRTSPADVSSP